MPNARMDDVGTVRIGTSALSPYMHGYIGVQIAEPLYINIRQTSQTSNILKDSEKLYPGLDLKLRLLKETATRPEISVGIQAAIGHKKMSGEYIALSKRYNNFDLTTGIGWGRFGSAAHLDNPLKTISQNFTNERDYNDEDTNSPSNWFSGDSVGFFAGLEYFTPYDGLSLKLDYGADNYASEKSTTGYSPASPWGVGLSYTYSNFANINIAAQGADKIIASLSLKSKPSKWPLTHKKYKDPLPYKKQQGKQHDIEEIQLSAQKEGIKLKNITTSDKTLFATLSTQEISHAPKQIGRALRHINAHIPDNIEEINITPVHSNIYGRTIKIIRSDVEKAVSNNSSSPQEIWKNADFIVSDKEKNNTQTIPPTKWINNDNSFKINLENQISLSEKETGALYRSSAIIETSSTPFLGFLTGTAMRINLSNNLDDIEKFRIPVTNPVRSDVNAFTDNRASLEYAYIGYAHSFSPDLHTLIMAGYLEEFYNGYGGEILYRPFSSRLALGAEIWNAARRDPYTALNLGLNSENIITGHINGWYDFPEQDLTLSAKAGRFLAGDLGVSLALEKIFNNGAKLSSSITLSNYAEQDIFGSQASVYHSMNLSLPFGSIPYAPTGSELKTKIAPFGRDIGQHINPPLKLFELSENLTLDHMAKHWTEIVD